MKAIIILLLISMSFCGNAQNVELNSFFVKHRQHPNVIAMAIPGWLIKFGINLSDNKENVDEYRPILRSLSHIRFFSYGSTYLCC